MYRYCVQRLLINNDTGQTEWAYFTKRGDWSFKKEDAKTGHRPKLADKVSFNFTGAIVSPISTEAR